MVLSNLNKARFKKAGQAFHLRIRTARDLTLVPDLDEAHWVASGTSTESIHTDPELEWSRPDAGLPEFTAGADIYQRCLHRD